MLEGARQIGLSSKEIPVERERVENNLQAGNLIIALMGPGEFTSNGHFIVLTGLQNGRLKINDPNSRKIPKNLGYRSGAGTDKSGMGILQIIK